MKIEDLVYDVFEIKGATEDDSDLDELWVLHKINNYRSALIKRDFDLSNEINPTWLQRVHKFSWEKTNAADDPAITYNSVRLGKYTLPAVISLPDDMGTYRVTGSSAILQLEVIDFALLMMKAEIGEQIPGEYGYYSKVGNVIYCYPYIMEGSAMIVADNPLDVQIHDPSTGALRDMVFTDEYPLDRTLAQEALLMFLKNDMAIAEGAITDIINDAQDQLKILKDVRTTQQIPRNTQ